MEAFEHNVPKFEAVIVLYNFEFWIKNTAK